MKRILQKQRIVCPLFFLLITGPLTLMAQTRTIIGRVIDSTTKTPLAGASVLLKGTSRGTATSVSGVFRLQVPDGGKLLIVNTGYKSMEVTPTNSDSLIITLALSNSQLNDVVVVGYGTQTKATLKGWCSSKVEQKQLMRWQRNLHLSKPLEASVLIFLRLSIGPAFYTGRFRRI